jgi:hypothetical protein
MEEGKTYRLLHEVTDGEKPRLQTSELIFESGKPYHVAAWFGPPGRLRPRLSTALDPEKLSKSSNPEFDYLYEGPIDPPKLHA